MSTLDEYEYLRGPVRRKPKGRGFSGKPRPAKRAVQAQFKLYGGGTRQEVEAERPFNDDIPF